MRVWLVILLGGRHQVFVDVQGQVMQLHRAECEHDSPVPKDPQNLDTMNTHMQEGQHFELPSVC